MCDKQKHQRGGGHFIMIYGDIFSQACVFCKKHFTSRVFVLFFSNVLILQSYWNVRVCVARSVKKTRLQMKICKLLAGQLDKHHHGSCGSWLTTVFSSTYSLEPRARRIRGRQASQTPHFLLMSSSTSVLYHS